MYNDSYKGNIIFYNAQMLPIAGHSIIEIKDDALDKSQKIAQDDAYFDSIPSRYNSLIPTVRYSSIQSEIETTINEAYTTITEKITSITNAIVDYCDGDGIISEENQSILDYLIKNSPNAGPLSGDPDGELGGDPDGYSGGEPSDADDGEIGKAEIESSTSLEIKDNVLDMNTSDDSTSISDGDTNETIVMPFIGENVSQDIQDISKEAVNDSVGSDNELLNTASTLIGSSSSLISIPSPTVGTIEGVKKSGMVAPLVITATAAAAVGGKIYYDKKKEDDDSNSDEKHPKQQETVVDKGFMSGVTSVEFKKDLLDSGEVIENE